MELNIFENDVLGNSSTLAGGGIAALSIAEAEPLNDLGNRGPALTNFTVRNNLVAGNIATDGGAATTAVGGGIYAYAEGLGGISGTEPSKSQIFLNFNTVAQNTSDTGSGGIEVESYTERDSFGDDGSATIEIEHSIVYDNTGFGIGGAQAGAGVLVAAGLAPIRGVQGVPANGGNTGILNLTAVRNSMFMNAGGDLESGIGPGPNMFTDPLLNASFTPAQCSDTIDAGNPLISAALEPAPNGPPGGPGLVNLGHTGATPDAVPTLADSTGDGYVDGVDVLRLQVAFASDVTNARWDATVDLDGDGFISGVDLALMAANFALSCP